MSQIFRRGVVIVALVFAAPTFAEAPPASVGTEGSGLSETDFGLPGPAPAAEAVDDLTNDIGSRMRCPVCQAMSVTDSPAESAVTMKGRIRELVALGYTESQIRAYFISRYGEWILLDPPMTGANWFLWATPAVVLIAGLALLIGSTRGGPTPTPRPPSPPKAVDERDERRRALLAELED